MKKYLKQIIIGLAVILVIIGYVIYYQYTKPFYPEINSPRPFKGVENAKVVLTEFSDFQCPACKAATEMVKLLDQKYGYRIKIGYRYFPLVSIHQNSFSSAMAAECANDQGKFWAYHDELFANQENLGRADLIGYAKKLNLDDAKFTACLDSGAKSEIVRADMTEGNKRGIDSTPTFYLNDVRVDDWRQLEKLVQKKLNE